MRPHRQQPTRLPCSWDSPGKEMMEIRSQVWCVQIEFFSVSYKISSNRSELGTRGASLVVIVVKNLLPMQETWDASRSLVREVPLEEGMAAHSSIPAWRIPWTEEPGGVESRGLQRVRHHWSYEARRSNGGELWLQTLSPQECLGERDKIRLNPHHTYHPSHDPQLELILSPHPSSPPWWGDLIWKDQ